MALAKQAEEAVGRWLARLTRNVAYGGGMILAMMAILTVVSVIGRRFTGIGLGPIKGDFELVEAGCAIAIFAFLPFAQMKRAHVTVDIFVSVFSERIQCFLGFLGDVLIAVASFVIFWRFSLGFGEKLPYGSQGVRDFFGFGAKPFFPETTYELELPIWIPYGMALFGATLFMVVSLYSVWRSLNWTIEGREQVI
jgi:TRAP-type C4-dicarboxylate transport system permease small subunit